MPPAGSATAPAPNYGPIFDVEPQAEAAAKAILSAAPYSVPNVMTQRDMLASMAIQGVRQYPCVQLQFVQGEEQGHRAMTAAGSAAPDAWNYMMNFSVLTKRGDTSHAAIRAAIMLHYQYFKDAYAVGVLPYHSLTQRKFAGCELSVDTAHDLDITTIRMAGVVSVRPGAWPTS